MTIVNDDSSNISKWGYTLIDDARVIIYSHHMFIILAHFIKLLTRLSSRTSVLYNKRLTIVNDDSSSISKWGYTLIDDARVITYDCNMFYSTGHWCWLVWNHLQPSLILKVRPGNSCWKGRLSTDDLLVLTSLDSPFL